MRRGLERSTPRLRVSRREQPRHQAALCHVGHALGHRGWPRASPCPLDSIKLWIAKRNPIPTMTSTSGKQPLWYHSVAAQGAEFFDDSTLVGVDVVWGTRRCAASAAPETRVRARPPCTAKSDKVVLDARPAAKTGEARRQHRHAARACRQTTGAGGLGFVIRPIFRPSIPTEQGLGKGLQTRPSTTALPSQTCFRGS